ncbi:MAG: sulfite exporter TauE/SafE family protein, partial [Deltaproteobacteria bacterium]|nr:sulfite exporter TauE/SafE family protein [Deltaproteobacteria bacterium]
GMAGAAVGARAGRDVPPTLLLLLLSGLMVAMALAMLRPRASGAAARPPRERHPGRALLAGFGVGTLTGLLGTGGGFMVVPALSLMGGFAMAEAVATSLFVISLNSAAGLGAALWSGTHVDPWLAGGMAAASVSGSLAGARLGRGLSAEALRQAFAAFLVLLGTAIAVRELSEVVPVRVLAPVTAAALGAVGLLAWRVRRGAVSAATGR